MDNKIALSSLAMDLKRVALGIHRNSHVTADKFLQEALQRKQEVDKKQLAPYLQQILSKLDSHISAEDALMYSTRIQNYVLYR